VVVVVTVVVVVVVVVVVWFIVLPYKPVTMYELRLDKLRTPVVSPNTMEERKRRKNKPAISLFISSPLAHARAEYHAEHSEPIIEATERGVCWYYHL